MWLNRWRLLSYVTTQKRTLKCKRGTQLGRGWGNHCSTGITLLDEWTVRSRDERRGATKREIGEKEEEGCRVKGHKRWCVVARQRLITKSPSILCACCHALPFMQPQTHRLLSYPIKGWSWSHLKRFNKLLHYNLLCIKTRSIFYSPIRMHSKVNLIKQLWWMASISSVIGYRYIGRGVDCMGPKQEVHMGTQYTKLQAH